MIDRWSAENKFQTMRLAQAEKPHGTHARYVGGCKCLQCRAAHSRFNSELYYRRRAGITNGVVDATPARLHLAQLRRYGIGRRTVADAAGVSADIVRGIANGDRPRARAATVRAILQVDRSAQGDAVLIPAARTWQLLGQLIERGYTRAQLALWLGAKTPSLQIRRDQVTVRTQNKVERLYRAIEAGRMRREA